MEQVQFTFNKGLRGFAALVKNEGATLYAVGGTVRNALIGLPSTDTDICSSLRPDKIIEICRRNGLRVIPKGLSFGTVEIRWGSERFEHTTFRSDHYSSGGVHRPTSIEFSDTVEEDAVRRDFSINAIYVDILSGEILDPTGGIPDLEKRIIRTTSADPYRVLADDGLRILRLVRFASELGFDIDGETFAAAKALCSNLRGVSSERISEDLN